MSDLQRSFAKAKLAGMPPFAPFAEEEEEGETDPSGFGVVDVETEIETFGDDDSSSASSASSTGTIRPTSTRNLFARPVGYVNVLMSSSLIDISIL